MEQNVENLFTCGVKKKAESSGKCHFLPGGGGGGGLLEISSFVNFC